MNCVDYAINRVMNSDIDEYLLKLAFESPNANFAGNWYNLVNQSTVSQGIREKVIFRTVLPASNVNGGKTEYIDLSGADIRDRGNAVIEVNVPDTLTGGRKIISVAEIYLGSMNSATGMLGVGLNENTSCGQGSLSDMTQGLIDSLSPSRSMPVTYTNIHMTGNNCFAIFGINSGAFSMTAKCLLEFDGGLSSISPRHYDNFAELVELAVKAYIYRVCKRPVAEAVMRSGVPIDGIRDDVSEYRDAWTQYKEYFDQVWKKCMAYSDRQRVHSSVQAATPRRM